MQILDAAVSLEGEDQLCRELVTEIPPLKFVLDCCPRAAQVENVAAAMRRHNINLPQAVPSEPMPPVQQQ